MSTEVTSGRRRGGLRPERCTAILRRGRRRPVLVLTGAGSAFCAGADLGTGSRAFDEPGAAFSSSPVDPPAWQVRKLVIAAINGHAIGIGHLADPCTAKCG
ncbi:enoyl-CoA hydratase-related protein [Nocardioides endophyticus]|uniref:enoyl-CoA hydratase-related protein n=1 Tax=Nocardioides endophyticus TaxID=1353775 RepID=UPI0031E98D92